MFSGRILMHSCCAPCSCYPVSLLSPNSQITLFYYNPNIYPETEYERRRDELFAYAEITRCKAVEGPRDKDLWYRHVRETAELGEGSERCRRCYEFRIRKTFEFAVTGQFESVGTTLSVSPHKKSEWILEIGSRLSSESGIPFVDIDFKQHDGFRKGAAIAKGYGLYRQNYCGCEYSLAESLERRKTAKTVL